LALKLELGLNFTTFFAGQLRLAPVSGLRPTLADLSATEKIPNLNNGTFSPLTRAAEVTSENAVKNFLASVFVNDALSAIASISSTLFMLKNLNLN
jgi:hypothetical protein